MPIFNGGAVRRELKINDIELKNQKLTIEQSRLNTNNMAVNAVLNYKNALEVIALEKNNLLINTENSNYFAICVLPVFA